MHESSRKPDDTSNQKYDSGRESGSLGDSIVRKKTSVIAQVEDLVPSGIILPQDELNWNISSITQDNDKPKETIGGMLLSAKIAEIAQTVAYNVIDALFDRILNLIEAGQKQNVKVDSSTFSRFLRLVSDSEIATLCNESSQKEFNVNDKSANVQTNCDVSHNVDCTNCDESLISSNSDKLLNSRDSLVSTDREPEVDVSLCRCRTRSEGCVSNFSNVQLCVIEYSTKK
jgi:hypothetical protein